MNCWKQLWGFFFPFYDFFLKKRKKRERNHQATSWQCGLHVHGHFLLACSPLGPCGECGCLCSKCMLWSVSISFWRFFVLFFKLVITERLWYFISNTQLDTVMPSAPVCSWIECCIYATDDSILLPDWGFQINLMWIKYSKDSFYLRLLCPITDWNVYLPLGESFLTQQEFDRWHEKWWMEDVFDFLGFFFQ